MSKNNKVIAVFTVLLAFILFIAMKPGDNPVMLMRIATITATIIFVGLILYTRVLWRWGPFKKLHRVVDIGGKWEGKVVYKSGESFEIDVTIHQYLDDIRVKIKNSYFLNDSLFCKMINENGGIKLYITYRSRPNGKIDSREQIEYGTFIINCDEDFLDGIFFTSSKESGTVELYRK